MVTRYLLSIVLSILVVSVAVAGDSPTLTISQPSPNLRLEIGKPVTISWESTYSVMTTFRVSFSRDGVNYDTPVASGLAEWNCQWTPNLSPMDLGGYLKVEAIMADGDVKGEAVVPVTFIPANAVVVSKANQRVLYFVNGQLSNVFVCSTALPKYDLDPGVYKVYSRQERHWSRKYEVWMDHSLFFHEGYALHATSMVKQLGRPASHGCVRLHPKDATKLFDMVKVGTPVIVLPKTKDCSNLITQANQPRNSVDVASTK